MDIVSHLLPYKGRALPYEERVSVYRNLHEDVWSVRHGGLVVAHGHSVALRAVEFVVQPAGNDEVRRTGRKTVHAFARGWLVKRAHIPTAAHGHPLYHNITYRPTQGDTGFRQCSGGPIRAVYEWAHLRPHGPVRGYYLTESTPRRV